MSRFHTYSFGNILEIARQRPEASRVAGLYAWNQLGRRVKKGERGIRILAPIIGSRRKQQKDAEERASRSVPRLVGFRAVYVFDVSQTDGRSFPNMPRSAVMRERTATASSNLSTRRALNLSSTKALHRQWVSATGAELLSFRVKRRLRSFRRWCMNSRMKCCTRLSAARQARRSCAKPKPRPSRLWSAKPITQVDTSCFEEDADRAIASDGKRWAHCQDRP